MFETIIYESLPKSWQDHVDAARARTVAGPPYGGTRLAESKPPLLFIANTQTGGNDGLSYMSAYYPAPDDTDHMPGQTITCDWDTAALLAVTCPDYPDHRMVWSRVICRDELVGIMAHVMKGPVREYHLGVCKAWFTAVSGQVQVWLDQDRPRKTPLSPTADHESTLQS